LGIGGVKAKGAELKAAQARGQRGVGEHEPWFVARKDLETNTLWVVQGHEHPWLQSTILRAQDCSWVAGAAPVPGAMAAKTRYRQADAACELRMATATD
jgi:tRNA-specific 2-thiouridylase